MTIQPRAFSVRQFVETYPVGRTTLFAMIQRGEIAAKRLGNKLVIEEGEARRWLDSLPAARDPVAA